MAASPKQRTPPPTTYYQHKRPNANNPQTSVLSGVIRWLELKKYQYEVTFSLYMLTSTEKIIFNSILIILLSLLITAASMYLPDHIAIICSRLWYYVHGSGHSTSDLVKKAGETVLDGTMMEAAVKETADAILGMSHSEL